MNWIVLTLVWRTNMVIGTPLGISPPRYGGDGPRGGGGGYGRPRTPDRYNSIHSFLCVSFNVMLQVQRRISGGAMGSARTSRWRPSRRSWRHGVPGSPAQGWTWPWSQGWFQGTTQGTSQVANTPSKTSLQRAIIYKKFVQGSSTWLPRGRLRRRSSTNAARGSRQKGGELDS